MLPCSTNSPLCKIQQLLLGVGAPIILLIVFVVIVNLIRSWKPHVLPARLQSWEALPLPLRSLQPYDRLFQACMCCKKDTDKPKDSTKLQLVLVKHHLLRRKNLEHLCELQRGWEGEGYSTNSVETELDPSANCGAYDLVGHRKGRQTIKRSRV